MNTMMRTRFFGAHTHTHTHTLSLSLSPQIRAVEHLAGKTNNLKVEFNTNIDEEQYKRVKAAVVNSMLDGGGAPKSIDSSFVGAHKGLTRQGTLKITAGEEGDAAQSALLGAEDEVYVVEDPWADAEQKIRAEDKAAVEEEPAPKPRAPLQELSGWGRLAREEEDATELPMADDYSNQRTKQQERSKVRHPFLALALRLPLFYSFAHVFTPRFTHRTPPSRRTCRGASTRRRRRRVTTIPSTASTRSTVAPLICLCLPAAPPRMHCFAAAFISYTDPHPSDTRSPSLTHPLPSLPPTAGGASVVALSYHLTTRQEILCSTVVRIKDPLLRAPSAGKSPPPPSSLPLIIHSNTTTSVVKRSVTLFLLSCQAEKKEDLTVLRKRAATATASHNVDGRRPQVRGRPPGDAAACGSRRLRPFSLHGAAGPAQLHHGPVRPQARRTSQTAHAPAHPSAVHRRRRLRRHVRRAGGRERAGSHA